VPVDAAVAIPTLKNIATQLRIDSVRSTSEAGSGHPTSCCSAADIVATLFFSEMRFDPTNPQAEGNDRFVLSKGHAALGLYAALAATGRIDRELLSTYCGEGSMLGAHPEHVLPGVDFSTGSLGQGLSIATGAALAARRQGSSRRVFALLSDAETNEGSIWEAAMFAAHHGLSNLVALIDMNGQQALGYTHEVMDPGPPAAARWEAFGWDVHDVDGTDPDAIARAIGALDTSAGPPHVLLARTVFGRGVSFMESRIEWHYLPLEAETHRQAVAELEAACPPAVRS